MGMVKSLDVSLSKWILGWPKRWQAILANITFFGEPWVILTIAATGFISAAARGQQSVKWAFFWAGVAYGINTFIKQITRRRRPHNRLVSMLGIKSYSFPSGHAFGCVIFYGLYGYLDFRYLTSPLDIITLLLLAVITILVGASRVSLGTHFPTDVIGGWVLGLIGLALIIGLVF